MRKFDYSFLNNGLLPANLVNLTAGIASLKTMAGARKEDHMNLRNMESYVTQETHLFHSLREEGRGKTVVLVSHRASTMRIADRVYSVEHGRMS